jgi:hypothetical protein
MKRYFTLVLCLFALSVIAQQRTALLSGSISDVLSGQPVDLATVFIKNTNIATESDEKGQWKLEVPAGQRIVLVFSRIGYKESLVDVQPLPVGAHQQIDISMPPSDVDVEVIVRESRVEQGGMIRSEVTELKLLPTTTGNLESVLPHIALGASSGAAGELTSQYNVRGGNYDENLVYVNDFEIYRPQLIRAAQQEGLTFPNIDLIQSLTFSSGGFEARYGDKQSSVLDIRYKRPEALKSSLSASLLGGSAHIEGSWQPGADSYRKLRFLAGARYKTTRYLLGSLDVSGEYSPNFSDLQAYLTYDLTRDLQIGLIGNFNQNKYQFIPESRNTALGLINFALQLYSVFDGQEIDDFTTAMGGVSLTYLPDRKKNPFFMKLLASSFRSDENERFDIIGRYSLRQIESNLGSGEFGKVVAELGAGTQHQYVRNFLDATVTNVELKGGIDFQNVDGDNFGNVVKSHFLQWSLKYQYEQIDDRINEWERLDSAGYSLPFDTSSLHVYNVLKSSNNLASGRLSAYLQDTYTWRNDSIAELKISLGVRAGYWDLNEEKFITPRAQLLYKPLRGSVDVSWRLAAGLYYQPPFYREMRNLKGSINTDLLSQKSAHVVGGFTWDFFIGKLSPTRFRLILEAYYKKLWDVVSYDVDNVKLRYSGENDGSGYVIGLDFRLNGEFVPGAESWVNISLLRAREQLKGVQHLEREIGTEEGAPVKDVPRPTDQLFTLSMFFQDYLPKNENFKMHLNFTVGSGLPYGLKDNNRIYRNTYKLSPYHRVDIGFSVALWNRDKMAGKTRHPLRFTKYSWLSLEVFNLMQVQNQASNTWIKTVFNQQFAIPNYLTSRRINLRWRVEF